jgi:hypothetical protein
MPYREKVTWLTLIAQATTLGPYLAIMTVAPPTAPMTDFRPLTLFAVAAVAQMLILGVGHLWLRISSPEDARVPADERDRAIARRALGAAYYTLLVGMILVGIVMPFKSSGWTIINAAIAAILVAEVVHHGVTIWSYRRGWHG